MNHSNHQHELLRLFKHLSPLSLKFNSTQRKKCRIEKPNHTKLYSYQIVLISIPFGPEPCNGVNCKRNSNARTEGSCHDSKCWAYCKKDENPMRWAWCYTTKGAKYSGEYVECTNDSRCRPYLTCADQCQLNRKSYWHFFNYIQNKMKINLEVDQN